MDLGNEAQQAVYELLEHGPISAERAEQYKGALAALVAARLVKPTPSGEYILSGLRHPDEETELLTLTLPAECVARLDMLAPTRGEAIARVIRARSGSGVWRKR